MVNQELEKRVLVVDDSDDIREFCIKNGQGIVDAPEISLHPWMAPPNGPGIAKLEEALRSRKYAVILMDGNLGYSHEDGSKIVEQIRSSERFGTLNRETRIIGFSSSLNIIGAEKTPGEIKILKYPHEEDAKPEVAMRYIQEHYL